jgi:small subunit ribosomal protein S3
MKQTIAKIMANRSIKGAKICLSGRLDGNEIARLEHMEQGSLPLQTLRAEIDFARSTAFTTYGTVGVKVWIYKGMKF